MPREAPAAGLDRLGRAGAARIAMIAQSEAVTALRVERLLGRGGVCEVWLAETAAGDAVALKTLKPEWRGQRGAAALLCHEGAVLAQLRHPHIVALLGQVDHHGSPALVMEYLGGGDLVPLVGAHPRHWIHAVHEVAGGLRQLRRTGFAHRDVKATNVLLAENGAARLIDFGSAARIGMRAAEGGVTAAHRRPGESGKRVSGTEDAYALAVLVYQLLSGRLPFGVRPEADLAGPPPMPLAAAWRDEPAVVALAEAVAASLASPDAPDEEPGAGRLWAVMDVIESVVAVYPRD